ncbi:energy transducer TonB family protein [Shimia marina]|nr:energy transducer TonB [Shimia marina]
MKTIQFTLCLCLAMGVLLMGFVVRFQGAPQSSGATGQAVMSLAASSKAVKAMVQSWEAPPSVAAAVVQRLKAVEATPLALELPSRALRAQVKLVVPEQTKLDMQPDQFSPPEMVTQPHEPPPDVKPAAVASVSHSSTATAVPQQQSVSAATRQKQQAKGNAKGSSAGKTGRQSVSSSNSAAQVSPEKLWGAAVRQMVERNKRYPAKARGQTGRVRVQITLAANGRLRRVVVVTSSGVRALDRAAIAAVRHSKRYPKAPEGFGRAQHSFNLTISFAQK